MKPFKKNYRYPWEVIKKALTMYHKSPISFRDVSKKLEEQEIYVSYKTIYDWNKKLGEEYNTKINGLQDMIKK